MKFLFSNIVKLVVLVALTIAFTSATKAQTNLAPGDIFIVGFGADAPDRFAFISFVPLAPGTSIGFTDGAYLSGGLWNGGENFTAWINNTGSTIAAGTVIVASNPNGTVETFDLGAQVTGSGALSGLAAAGDQIFIYQTNVGTVANTSPFSSTSATAANFIGGELLFGIDIANNTGFITVGTGNSNESYLPDAASGGGALVIGTSAVEVPEGLGTIINNAQLPDAQRTTAGTTSEYKTRILTPANWAAVTGATALSSTDFAASTAANAAISGRVTTTDGTPLKGARVVLTDDTGVQRLATSNAFGFYGFGEVEAGRSYVVSAASKRYQFTQPTQFVSVNGNVDGVNFVTAK